MRPHIVLADHHKCPECGYWYDDATTAEDCASFDRADRMLDP